MTMTKEPKHRMSRRLPAGPRHLSRLRLSAVVRALEFSRAEIGDDGFEHEWFEAREQRVLELGAQA
jgi:hypothetical protein